MNGITKVIFEGGPLDKQETTVRTEENRIYLDGGCYLRTDTVTMIADRETWETAVVYRWTPNKHE